MTELEQLRRELFRARRDNEKLRLALEGAVPLDRTQLAEALGKHPNYVTEMKRQGFPMPGFRATLSDAKVWIEATGFTRSGGVRNGDKPNRTKRGGRAKMTP